MIQAAAEAFMEEGYRASIDRIAKRAGVARQTIYNHFPSKEDLFSEVANVIVNTILVSLDGATGDMRERLMRFALVLRQRVLSDEGIGMFRTIIAEVPRFPALGQAFLEKGPEQTIRRLADFIFGAMNAGTLRRDEPLFAAEMLLSMLEGFYRTRRLLGAPMLSVEEEQEKVARIVDCFLRAYAPEP
ncbi:MAG: TetR/AcrR family transcriptional regulator [Gammaproteobacteria bacterium]|nr:TetR/AcrR family transcriptional regulator [Gammaproteobacteria bacterium]MBU3990119.1 TetR/AcrR family transcriptional regulator [Gammaproteobacteria bacterium]MBU4004899.1 TetR/AcrR family transcriptional regulator [Gammaproteobacteria bacterium]MBU4020492.1 TetR/AcrR family transcriptional regulator [Gammaproteobacteria bacterium]MBU4095568.1 TetR/AcrR family transcriptional regulator [Gammaproteobacteria bacterium]